MIALLRIAMGWIFFWGFLDKTFGFGFATPSAEAWIHGGLPSKKFLLYASKGPLSEIFQALAGNAFVDWLFMGGLFGIGIALLFGIASRLTCLSGVTLMFLMWAARLPPSHNPVLDEHIIYGLLFILFFLTKAGHVWGFGQAWERSPLIKRFLIFK